MKTNSSAKKRFKRTGSGKFKRNQAGTAHLLRKKTKKAKLRLRGTTLVAKCNEKRLKDLLCL